MDENVDCALFVPYKLFNKEDKGVAFTYLNVFSINEYSSELNMKLFQAVSIIPRM